ncbi:MAG TPA: IniB N-terminal domain-containing protein [Mycobacterium sp.]|nr:IniB N-terminal domain-containing protein [Mycobacterium sp.]
MTTLLDYILDLFRSPDVAASFVRDPDGALRDAGLPNVSPAQLQAVAATAAPAGLALGGGGDPVVGLQRAVANHHSIASPFSPQTTFAPQTQTEFASRNNTDVASNNDFMSPDQAAGANAQNGAFNLGFGDITLGDKTTNTATDGGVVNTGNAGDIDATNVEGDGNVVGNEDTNANTGVINDSNVNMGDDNEIDDSGDTTAGGDVIQDNEGPVINDVDMSGGNGGNASSSGGGGLLGIGNDSEANAGGGGGGGGIVINDNDSTSTNTGGGDVTTVDTGGGDISGSVDASHDDNSVDNSQTDNSVDNSQTVETNVDVTNDVGIF